MPDAPELPDDAEESASPAPDEAAGAPSAGMLLDQGELDRLTRELAEKLGQPVPPPARAPAAAASTAPSAADVLETAQAEVDALAAEMAAAIAAEQAAAAPPQPALAPAPPPAPVAPAVLGATRPIDPADAARPFAPPDLSALSPPGAATLDLLDDVDLEVQIELGRTDMFIEDVLRLGPGSVIELDKLAGDPVDIFVDKKRIARGEVLVLNNSFCVRISHIQSPLPELEGTG